MHVFLHKAGHFLDYNWRADFISYRGKEVWYQVDFRDEVHMERAGSGSDSSTKCKDIVYDDCLNAQIEGKAFFCLFLTLNTTVSTIHPIS